MWDMRAMYHWPGTLVQHGANSAYSDMLLLQGTYNQQQQQQARNLDKHLADSLHALHSNSHKQLCLDDARQKKLSAVKTADCELRTAMSGRQHNAPSLPHRRPAPRSSKIDLSTAEKAIVKASHRSRVASFFIADILAASSECNKMESDAVTIVRPWDSTTSSTSSSAASYQRQQKRSSAAAHLSQGGSAAHRASGAATGAEAKVKGTSPLSALLQMTSKTFLDDSNTQTAAECGSAGPGGSRLGVLSGLNQSSKKKRKSRTAFTNAQIYELERRFLRQKYLTPNDRDDIARSLGLSNAQVITWFQNRRAKLKRDLEELKADMSAAALTGHPDMTTIFGSVEELQLYQHKHGLKTAAHQRSSQADSEGHLQSCHSPCSISPHQSLYEGDDDDAQDVIMTSSDDSNGSNSDSTENESHADRQEQGPEDNV